MKKYVQDSTEKKKLWYVKNAADVFGKTDWQQALVAKNLLCTDMSLFGIVLFGGYVVDDAWLKKSRAVAAEKNVLEPLWQVEGAVVRKSVQMCLHNPFCAEDDVIPNELLALIEAKPDRLLQQEVRATGGRTVLQTELRSLWVWRESRSEITTKTSWLICGNQEQVNEDEAKRTEHVNEIKALAEKNTKLKEHLMTKKTGAIPRKKLEQI